MGMHIPIFWSIVPIEYISPPFLFVVTEDGSSFAPKRLIEFTIKDLSIALIIIEFVVKDLSVVIKGLS